MLRTLVIVIKHTKSCYVLVEKLYTHKASFIVLFVSIVLFTGQCHRYLQNVPCVRFSSFCLSFEEFIFKALLIRNITFVSVFQQADSQTLFIGFKIRTFFTTPFLWSSACWRRPDRGTTEQFYLYFIFYKLLNLLA